MNPTNEHRAREIVLRVFRLRANTELGGQYQRLVEAFASALSSHDTEVRDVLRGLASKVYVSFQNEYCWCARPSLATRPEGDRHDTTCTTTRALYAKLQPKESSDVTE